MADYNDDRRRFDEERNRFRDDRNANGRPDWRDPEHALGDQFGENWSRWNDNGRSRQDFGRDGDYSAGNAGPRSGNTNLNRRPGGMRDDDWNRGSDSNRDNWNQASNWQGGRYGAGRNFANRQNLGDYRGNYGSYPSDNQDYGDWQGQGGSFSDYGAPRFGSNAPRSDSTYGGGYRDSGYQSQGYSSYGDQDREHNRNFWNKATDEVASWAGDQDAERRRRDDHLRGHSGRGPKDYTRSDDRIREDVSDRLTDDWQLDATNIDVGVSNGEVTLGGTVDNRDAKHRAEHLIENLSGVRHVQNNLRVDENWQRGAATDRAASTPVGSSSANTSLGSSTSQSGTSSAGTSRTGVAGTNGNASH